MEAECASVQKQVDVYQRAEQTQMDMTTWLISLLQQLNQAVSSLPTSPELRELIAQYQVCDLYCISAAVCYHVIN